MDHDSTADSMIEAYTAGPLFDTWRARQDAGLWPSELAMIQAHCRNPEAMICNIGCGAGRETFALYRRGCGNLVGIDCSEALLKAARGRCREEGLSIRFEAALADRLPFAESSIDVITMFENLYGHITPHDARLRSLVEARRVLKPGGVILMTVTSMHHSVFYRLYMHAIELLRCMEGPRGMEQGDKLLNRKRWPPGATRMTAPRTHWFRPEEIPADATRTGLTVIQRTTTNAVVRNSAADSLRYWGEGRLAYVLGRPTTADSQRGERQTSCKC
jgi:SAM-dependent methyltransferase